MNKILIFPGIIIIIFLVVLILLTPLGFVLIGGETRFDNMCGLTNITKLYQNSDLVVIGFAEDSKNVVTDFLNAKVETQTKIRIERVIKGTVDGNTIIVAQPGGRVGNYRIIYSSAVSFDKGEKVLLFLKEKELRPYGGFSKCGGKYTINRTDKEEEILPCLYGLRGCFIYGERKSILLEDFINQITGSQ